MSAAETGTVEAQAAGRTPRRKATLHPWYRARQARNYVAEISSESKPDRGRDATHSACRGGQPKIDGVHNRAYIRNIHVIQSVRRVDAKLQALSFSHIDAPSKRETRDEHAGPGDRIAARIAIGSGQRKRKRERVEEPGCTDDGQARGIRAAASDRTGAAGIGLIAEHARSQRSAGFGSNAPRKRPILERFLRKRMTAQQSSPAAYRRRQDVVRREDMPAVEAG